MADARLPMANESTTDTLLGQILQALDKQNKLKKNSDKVLFYGQEEQIHADDEHTKQLIETTGGKDKNKTIDEVADFAREQTVSLKVQEEFARQEAQEQSEQDLFKDTLTKFGELKEIVGTKLVETMENFGSAIVHNTASGTEQFKKGVNELKNGIGFLGPIVNSITTTFHKLRAGFDLVFGGVRATLSAFSATKKFFFGLSKKEQAQEDLLQAEEEYRKAEEDLIRQQQLEGQPNKVVDPLPLPVTMEGFKGAVGGAEEKEEKVILGADGQPIGDKEEVDERSDALKKAQDRKESAEMILMQQRETFERDHNKKRSKGLKGFFKQGKLGFTKFFAQLSLMSLVKFLMPLAGIALLILALFTDLPKKLIDMVDKTFGLGLERDADGNLITDKKGPLGLDMSDARGLRNITKVPGVVQPGIDEFNELTKNKPKTRLNADLTGPSKGQQALTSMKKFSKALGPAGTLISPFMIAADYGSQNADRLSSRAGVIEAFEQGMLFKPGPNGQPIPVTAEDMVLFEMMSEADASGDFAGTLGDYGVSLGSAALVTGTGMKAAAAVAAIPAPGMRIAGGIIALASLFAGYKTSKALDDAGVNEAARAVLDATFDRKAFNRIVEERGLDPADVDYNEMRRQYEEMIKRAIQEDQDAKSNSDGSKKETANLNLPVIQQQYNMDSNFYNGGSMNNSYLDLSIDKAYG